MKKILSIINVFLCMAMILMVSVTQTDVKVIEIDSKINRVNSDSIKVNDAEQVAVEVSSEEDDSTFDEVEEEPEIVVEEKATTVIEKPQEEEKKEESPSASPSSPSTPPVDSSTITAFVGDKFTAKMSGYGSDIGDFTASGQYIRESIYYQDPTYGEVRILSGGREYPFGTIVKVTDSSLGEFYGIVLDRGGNIGRGEGKKFAFDLLFKTTDEAFAFGVSTAQFEILRVGY